MNMPLGLGDARSADEGTADGRDPGERGSPLPAPVHAPARTSAAMKAMVVLGDRITDGRITGGL
ncbi:MAG: hypothetical protein H0W82_00280 [Actinobacteria bacterium]|nr:hypothetical protein [Actinomycetota bacterium]